MPESARDRLGELPPELLTRIVTKLLVRSLIRLGSVNKSYRRFVFECLLCEDKLEQIVAREIARNDEVADRLEAYNSHQYDLIPDGPGYMCFICNNLGYASSSSELPTDIPDSAFCPCITPSGVQYRRPRWTQDVYMDPAQEWDSEEPLCSMFTSSVDLMVTTPYSNDKVETIFKLRSPSCGCVVYCAQTKTTWRLLKSFVTGKRIVENLTLLKRAAILEEVFLWWVEGPELTDCVD